MSQEMPMVAGAPIEPSVPFSGEWQLHSVFPVKGASAG